MRPGLLATSAILSAILSLPAVAQDNTAAPDNAAAPNTPLQQATGNAAVQQPGGTGAQVAEQCITDLQAFNQEATGTLQTSGIGLGAPEESQLRQLTDAAMIFAQNGNEQACEMVLAEIRNTFTAQQQAFMAANPDVNAYQQNRQQQLSAAVPVSEVAGVVLANDVIGSDVRNPQDETIGTISNVLLDPATGKVAYVMVERGGFLGMGDSNIPVPWADLHVSPELNTYVLNVSTDEMENAPTLDDDAMSDPSAWQTDIDGWWQQNLNSPG